MTKANQPDRVDIDRLFEELQQTAERTKELSDDLEALPTPERGVGERLIEEISQNLETIRMAGRLPDKDAAEFRATIKRQQGEIEI